MVYTITVCGILLIFVIEYFIQRNDSTNTFKFFKSVSLYKTIEQILIVVLSATLAILFTNANEEEKTKKKYYDLLETVYVELYTEESFLHSYVNNDPSTAYLENATTAQFNELLKTNDRSLLLENIMNSNEATLVLTPQLYGIILTEYNSRKLLLNAVYTDDYSVYETRNSALAMLDNADIKLLFLIAAEMKCLQNKGNDEALANEYYETFINGYTTAK